MQFIVTDQQMQEAMAISAKTLRKFVSDGTLPPFSYGSGSGKKRGWWIRDLDAFFKLKRIQRIGQSGQVNGSDMAVKLLCGLNAGMSQDLADHSHRNTVKDQLRSKKMPKAVRVPRDLSVAAGF